MESPKYSIALLKKANQLLGSRADNIDHLESVRDQLLARKDELERDLAISNKTSDSELSRLLTRAQGAAGQIDSLRRSVEPLRSACDAFVSAHSELCESLAPPLAAEELRLKERSYRAFLRRLTRLSDGVRERLAAGQLEEALARLRELHTVTAGVVAESRCHALAEYCRGLVSAWRGHLLRRLTAQLDSALSELRYPFISTNTAVHSAPPGPEAQQRLEMALSRLAALAGCGEDPAPPRAAVLTAAFPPASLPVRLLLRPLVRRFVFHFHGEKRTNDPARPEWYMGQVLQWITDHEQFLETSVEPTLAKALPECRPRLEFCRGLVELTVDKLLRDLPDLQYDDAAFSHTVDETLQLHRSLAQLGYGGGGEQPGPLLAVCQPGYLQKWVAIERKFALERVDQMMASETAWTVMGEQGAGVTELADGALTLLQAMTERFLLLPEPGQRLRFLELQLELLDDLRVRLLQLLRIEHQTPLGERCCALLNTVHHLRRALSEWGEQPVFLHLQYFRRRLAAAESAARAAEEAEEAEPTLSLDQVLSEPAPAAGSAPASDSDPDGLETTAFDGSVRLFQRIEDDIAQMMVDQILLEVRARSRPYRKERWFAMPSPAEFVSPNLTPSACPMMQVLTQCLQQLRGRLASPVFTSVRRSLASQLCDYLYDELVMANRFNEGGAAQLQYDITANLLAVFTELGGGGGGGQSEFRPLLSAAALLTLPTGSALLLLDTIKESPETAGRALVEAGAPGLTPEEAREVLVRRTALSVS